MILDRWLRTITIACIDLYQATLSPDQSPLFRSWLKGRICMHLPHCSAYAKSCFERYSFFRALSMSLERISHCTGGACTLYDPPAYRLVFFSSAPIGVPFLRWLVNDPRFDVVWVVTMPDAPVGRGMKLQENIIKQEAKQLLKRHPSKIILLHGKNATPHDKRYPWFVQEIEKLDIPIFAPMLPQSENPVLADRLTVIDSLNPDEETLIVGHSRGGVAILRWIEQRQQKVGKIILVATNDSVCEEQSNGFFSDKPYKYEMIKQYCTDFVVFHSTDDRRVPFSDGQKIAQGLAAKTWFPTGYNHFGYNDSPTLPELLPYLYLSVDWFIQTPQSLRLDSKKWWTDAEQCKAWISALQPDMLVVIAYGKLIPQRLLDLPSFWSINVHGSLLPKYRGASPLQSVFLHGDKESGITIMRMDAGLDTGDMLRLLATPLPLHRTVKDLIQWIQEKWPAWLQDTLRERWKGRIEAIPQDDTLATHCAKFTKEDGCVDPFAESMLEIYRKRQAFALWPKLYFLWNDQRYVLHEMQLHPETTRDDLTGPLLAKTPSNHYAFHPCILSVSIAPEGKKQLTGKEFLDGYMNKG